MIAENLERLKILDPVTYAAIAAGCEQVDIEYEDDIMAGCIQRAIAAKGWDLTQTQLKSSDIKCHAAIYLWKNGLVSHHGYADTPAAAILAAYCEACK